MEQQQKSTQQVIVERMTGKLKEQVGELSFKLAHAESQVEYLQAVIEQKDELINQFMADKEQAEKKKEDKKPSKSTQRSTKDESKLNKNDAVNEIK